jgi:hypothetical protein
MRKLLFLPLLLLLAACGATSLPATPAAETGNSTAEAVEAPVNQGSAAVVTGATPAEAAIVREQDWSKGPDEATVSIIEYGDFQ